MFFKNSKGINIHNKWFLVTALVCTSGVFLVTNNVENVQASTIQAQTSDTSLPEGVNADDVLESGVCGTSPYYITKDHTLYFMDGTLGSTGSIAQGAYGSYVEKIDTSKANKVYAPANSNNLFGAYATTSKLIFKNLTSMDLSKLDTSNVTSMYAMFAMNQKLTSLDLSNFDTSKVTDMKNMFNVCTSLKSLNISSFDTSNVTQMEWMFNKTALDTVDLSNFDTSKVTTMRDMFSRMPNLKNLDISNLDMTNVTNTIDMFVTSNPDSVILGPKNNFQSGTTLTTTNNENASWVNVVDSNQPQVPDLAGSKKTSVDLSTIVPKYFTDNPDTENIMLKPSVDSEQLYKGSLTLPYTTKGDKDNGSKVINNVISTVPGEIELPDDNGFKPNPKSVNVVSFDVSTNSFKLADDSPVINYTAEKGTSITATVTIKITKDGVKDDKEPAVTVKDVTGNVGDTINITVPSISDDYTADSTTIPATVNSDGTITTNSTVNYTSKEKPSITGTLTIQSVKDGKDYPVTVQNVTGKIGDTVDVEVPEIDGYTANKTTVKATVNEDKSITTTDTVIYTKNSSGSSSSNNHSDSNQVNISHREITISTFPTQSETQLYSLNGNTMSNITNRALGSNSDWFSDETVSIKGQKYYRVASNEWVKADSVYEYVVQLSTISIGDSNQVLTSAEGKAISNRELAANTSWKTDRIAYINGEKFYRVATNEFVKAADVDTNH